MQELSSQIIDAVRRQTRPIALKIEASGDAGKLNDDFLRVTSVQGEENVSQLYQFNVELRADDMTQLNQAKLDTLAQLIGPDLIGLWAQLRINCATTIERFTHQPLDAPPQWEDLTPSRYFRGIITSVSMGAPGVYHITLQAPIFTLTLRNRYHIFRNKSIQDLITEILLPETANNKLVLDFRLDGATITRIQDWLQAGESDYSFLQRVIAKASIHFYFIHYQSTVTLVFSNRKTAPQEVDIPGASQLPLVLRYSYTSVQKMGRQQDDLLCDLRYQVKMVQQRVRTVLTRSEAQWEDNAVAGFTSYDQQHSSQPGSIEYQRHRSYSYGTNLDETEGQLKKLCQQLDTEQGTLSGTSTSPLLSPGYTFKLQQEAPFDENSPSQMRPQFSDRIYVVTKIQHKISDTESYTGSIEATEISTDPNDFGGTFITPFSMESTQQGSVLAEVLESAVPRGWRYREKNNFQPELGKNQFESDVEREKGCLVRLATAKNSQDVCWVRLSQSMQTAPEVGAMVQISRAQNESELPEINVIASHGSKTIQPPDRRNESWTANTSWGSNYSTSYGDSISIRFGHYSPTDLEQAKKIVESSFDQPDMLGHQYKDSSFSRGGSFGFSSSDQEDSGVLSASVSQGSNFNESHALISYGVSDTGTSQNYSRVGKSVSRSVIGEYNGAVDFSNPNFINGKVPEQSIIDIADSLSNGDTYNESHIKGKTINLSGTGTSPPGYDDKSATVYSNSKTVGKMVSKSDNTGNSYNTSLHTGNSENSSQVFGNSKNNSLTIGNTDSINTQIGSTDSIHTQIGNTSSINTFVGTKEDISTTISANTSISTNIGINNSLSTNISASNNLSTNVGASNNISTNVSASNNVNTTIGISNNLETFIGAKNNISTRIADTNDISTSLSNSNSIATNIGTSNSITTNISASNTTNTTLGVSNTTETFIGAKNTTSTNLAATNSTSLFLGATAETSIRLAASDSTSINIAASNSDSINLAASTSTSLNLGSSMSMNLNGASSLAMNIHGGMEISLSSGSPYINVDPRINLAQKNVETKMVTLIVIL